MTALQVSAWKRAIIFDAVRLGGRKGWGPNRVRRGAAAAAR
jgi:hypothetical protein